MPGAHVHANRARSDVRPAIEHVRAKSQDAPLRPYDWDGQHPLQPSDTPAPRGFSLVGGIGCANLSGLLIEQ